MRITQITEEEEFAFEGWGKCECCGFEQPIYGWKGEDFWNIHLPEIECRSCGKSRRDYEREKRKIGTTLCSR